MLQPGILIIDDDKELCEELTDILCDEGYFVNTSNDGLKGKKNIEEGGYDLLILDIKLPGLSGFDILKSIREQNIKIKVIVVSGRPENIAFLEKNIIHKNREMEEENILKSADAVISKPINVRIMLDKTGELLSKNNELTK